MNILTIAFMLLGSSPSSQYVCVSANGYACAGSGACYLKRVQLKNKNLTG